MTRAELTAKLLEADAKAFGHTVRDSITVETDEAARRVNISMPAFEL
jgi:hypothetical protein